MKAFGAVFMVIYMWIGTQDKIRDLTHNGAKVRTTYNVEHKFYGKYVGSKSGFLLLKDDGSGSYRYDYPGISPDCPGAQIEFSWGFIVDEGGEVVKFKRSYGYSYPIIYNCTSKNTFQGCTKPTMVDYILVYDDGTITVSSSDDWEKTDP